MYGVDGNRTATVPPSDSASGSGDHLPADNMARMGPAAFNGAGGTDRPSESDKGAIANQPAPRVVGNGGPVGSSPQNSDTAQPAGGQVTPSPNTEQPSPSATDGASPENKQSNFTAGPNR
jgi:hypothetical protein